MEGFKEGYDFFAEHAGNFFGLESGDQYVSTINTEIQNFSDSVAKFKGDGTQISQLKGDLAEFWHSGSFNIKAAVRGSSNRTFVDRSHELGSVDVSSNFGKDYGLKYYKNGVESAKAQAKSLEQAYKKYQSKHPQTTLEEFRSEHNISDEMSIKDSIYTGQYRLVPSNQLKEAEKWLNEKIAKEENNRSEEVYRYKETLEMLKNQDRITDNNGNESIPLSEKDARELARLAKEGKVDPEKWGLRTEELVQFEDIMRQGFHAGLTAATISLVLRTAPEIINALKYLIENGEIEEAQFKKIGFAAVEGASEGFIRGTVSASITAACKAGLLGSTLKSIDPGVIGAATVLVMGTMKNAYLVAAGKMTRGEMVDELVQTMFTSTCALILGGVTQSLIHIPVFGYMIGSFVGSLAGSFIYKSMYQPFLSFCADTGFTMFGLVDQNYELPDDVLREMDVDVFDYEKFDYEEFKPAQFEYKKFTADRFEPAKLEMTFLRRGVIGVNAIGFV